MIIGFRIGWRVAHRGAFSGISLMCARTRVAIIPNNVPRCATRHPIPAGAR